MKRAFDVEGPMGGGTDVRLTLGDAILVGKAVKVSHVHSATFKNQLTIPTVRGVTVHVVDTHLEAYSTGVRLAQAKELVKGALRSRTAKFSCCFDDLTENSGWGPQRRLDHDQAPAQSGSASTRRTTAPWSAGCG